jgi:hypothetical protein
MKLCQGVAFLSELGSWDAFQSMQITFPPYFLIGNVKFPKGNLDNFDLRLAG